MVNGERRTATASVAVDHGSPFTVHRLRRESSMKLVECVPNFSEGRRPEIVAAIRSAIAEVDGVSVLDVSSDASHNRSVITFIASVDTAVDAAFAGIKAASERIDLCNHSG